MISQLGTFRHYGEATFPTELSQQTTDQGPALIPKLDNACQAHLYSSHWEVRYVNAVKEDPKKPNRLVVQNINGLDNIYELWEQGTYLHFTAIRKPVAQAMKPQKNKRRR